MFEARREPMSSTAAAVHQGMLASSAAGAPLQAPRLTAKLGASAEARPAAPMSRAEARKPRRRPYWSATTPRADTPNSMAAKMTLVSSDSAVGPTPAK